MGNMGTKLPASEASAYEALDRLLYREWDPIGVHGLDGPDSEYQTYLPGFWRLVQDAASPADLAAYLSEVETSSIGVTTSSEHRLDVASKAVALMAAWRLPVRA